MSVKSSSNKLEQRFDFAQCHLLNIYNEMLMNQKHGQTNVDPGLVLTELQLERLDPE